jgi:hypothetical protein
MLYEEHSNAARPCQWPNVDIGYIPTPATPVSPSIVAWARTGSVDVGRVVATVAGTYNDAHPAAAVEVTPAAILGTGRQPDVAWARHLCAYLLVEDAKLAYHAAALARGRTNHTTVLNSKTRVAAALDHDTALAATLARARALLAGEVSTPAPRRPTHAHQSFFAGATPAELAEYRYWRHRSLQAGYAW